MTFNPAIDYIVRLDKLIEGEINPGSPKNCYGPLLTKLNLNAADAVKEGKNNAFIRLVSSLLEIDYDDLKRREKTRLLRRNFLIGGIISVFLVLFSCVFWYFSPHTRLYGDYVTKWEIPEGIEETRLSKKQAKNLPFHYEITTKCSRPVKLVCANSAGIPCEENWIFERQNRPSISLYAYKNPYFPTNDKKKWKLSSASCVFFGQ